MTWLSRICFSGLFSLSCLAQAVSGHVELVDSREASVRKQKDFSGVVLWLEPLNGPAPLPSSKTFRMIQKGKRFTPHVLAVPVGATVDFPNLDPIFHNAFSNFSGQPFDVGLYPPGTTRKVHFHRAGVVRVFCNIHSTMSAVIVVLKTPYYAVTDASGAWQIDGAPPGEYLLGIWHERATESTLKALSRKITLDGTPLELPVIRISESGYLEVPHKNKYGKDYPPEPEDRLGYPGGRK
jgi:plastocyanin